MAARTYLMTAVAVVWVLSITPLVAYLTKGWKTRRDGLLKYFKPHAIALYFRQFYPAEGAPPPHPDGAGDYTDEEKAALTHAFTKKYRKYAGVTSLITPIGGIALITGLMLCWTGQTVAQWLMVPNGPAVPGALPLPAVTAFLGGLMWVLNDHATRWPSWDFGKAE